jgi:MPBQ/MSBQ methyltransferase
MTHATDLADMYGGFNLSTSPIFPGGLINFGYSSQTPATVDDRIKAQLDLYRQVLAKFGPMTGSSGIILEVGCGLGEGCRLLARDRPSQRVIGLDISEDQIIRAKLRNEVEGDVYGMVEFVVGRSDRLPFSRATISAILSVEAAQHFADWRAFIAESSRVLNPGGVLVVATFFARHRDALDLATQRIPTIARGIDHLILVDDFLGELKNLDFTNIVAKPIGDHVWSQFADWCRRVSPASTWPRAWLELWSSGHVDYFIISAAKKTI